MSEHIENNKEKPNKKKKKTSVLLRTYGCQMNEYDSLQVREILIEGGYEFVNSAEDADIFIFNTCSVRSHAEDRVFGRLYELVETKKNKPHLIVGLMGCMASAYQEKLLRRFKNLDFVVGTKDYTKIKEILDEVRETHIRKAYLSEYDTDKFSYSNNFANENRIKAYLPIMRGCDNYCSYCIVPYVRGRERSRKVDEIVNEVNKLVESGIKEIILIGQNVNSYGNDFSFDFSFLDLLATITKINGVELVRFMSSHPKDISNDLILFMKDNPKIERHLHLPMQSGSDKVLALMNRKYTVSDYMKKIEFFKKHLPYASLTTDIIVGFCDESKEDYLDTKKTMQKIAFDGAFIFKYSTREGTKAEEFDDNVLLEEKKWRNNDLLSLQRKISLERSKRFLGRTERVLVYGRSKKNQLEMKGKTFADKEVVFRGDDSLIGKIVDVQLLEIVNETFRGNLIPL